MIIVVYFPYLSSESSWFHSSRNENTIKVKERWEEEKEPALLFEVNSLEWTRVVFGEVLT